MTLNVRYDDRRRWVYVRATGALAIADLIGLIRTARASAEYETWPMLFDARAATTDATIDDLERVIETVRLAKQARGTRAHVAIVADDAIFFDRMLYYETRCAEIGVPVIRVFRTVDDAERWLQIVSAARYFV